MKAIKRGKFYKAWNLVRQAGLPQTRESAEKRQQGVSLLISILAVSMIMIFTANMIVNAQVNLELAVSSRDNIKAEYMAKSGLNLGLFLLSADFGLDLFMAGPASPTKVAPSDGPGDIWAMMNGLPIGGSSAELLAGAQEQFSLSSVLDSSVLDTLKDFDGSFVLDIKDEASRINLNDCSEGRCSRVMAMLEALLSCPAEKAYLTERNILPEQLTDRLKDWVDKDKTASSRSGYNDEDDPYQKVVPPYHAKNAPFDSIEELKMVDGWDDDLFTIFEPYLTVYPYRKSSTEEEVAININTASQELLTCLLPGSRVDCNEKAQIAFYDRSSESTSLADSKEGIKKVLQETFCEQAAEAGSKEDKASWFAARSSVFRVASTALVGNQEKTITAIIERVMPDPQKKQTKSYRVLHWRLL